MNDIFDNYSVFLTKEGLLSEPNTGLINVFDNPTPASNLISGELVGNTTIKDGYLQSSNFVTGVSGWQLTPKAVNLILMFL